LTKIYWIGFASLVKTDMEQLVGISILEKMVYLVLNFTRVHFGSRLRHRKIKINIKDEIISGFKFE
jgi:hypothetical protein